MLRMEFCKEREVVVFNELFLDFISIYTKR